MDDVYQNSPNDRQVVGCCKVARTPAGGKRCRKRSAAESRPQILPGPVRDGDIGFQGIIVFVTGDGHLVALRLQIKVPVIDHFNIACGVLELAGIDHALFSDRSMNPSGKFFQRVFKGRRVCLG